MKKRGVLLFVTDPEAPQCYIERIGKSCKVAAFQTIISAFLPTRVQSSRVASMTAAVLLTF